MDRSLPPDDSHAALRVRLADINRHAAREPAAQTLSDIRNSCWRAIGREDYLLVVGRERNEEMEELFVHLLFLRKELNIIHDYEVELAVLLLEAVRRSCLQRIRVICPERL